LKTSKLVVCVLFVVLQSLFVVGSFAANYLDCETLNNESNASCVNPTDCGPGGCQSMDMQFDCPTVDGVDPCDNTPCTAVLSVASKKFGNCENTYWDYGCASCAKYYCNQFDVYETKDANGQCQNQRCSQLGFKQNGCAPAE